MRELNGLRWADFGCAQGVKNPSENTGCIYEDLISDYFCVGQLRATNGNVGIAPGLQILFGCYLEQEKGYIDPIVVQRITSRGYRVSK